MKDNSINSFKMQLPQPPNGWDWEMIVHIGIILCGPDGRAFYCLYPDDKNAKLAYAIDAFYIEDFRIAVSCLSSHIGTFKMFNTNGGISDNIETDPAKTFLKYLNDRQSKLGNVDITKYGILEFDCNGNVWVSLKELSNE